MNQQLPFQRLRVGKVSLHQVRDDSVCDSPLRRRQVELRLSNEVIWIGNIQRYRGLHSWLWLMHPCLT